MARRVRVGVDAEAASGVEGDLDEVVRRVLPLGPRVDLDGDVVLAQASKTARASKVDCGRVPRDPSTSRPVQCPSTFIRGFSIARSIRAVISRDSMRSFECTLATTTSSRSSMSGRWSSAPSSRMSVSMPESSRMPPAPSSLTAFSSSSTSSCSSRRSALRPLATVRFGEWSEITRYSSPTSCAARAIVAIGVAPSDHSVWLCRSPFNCARRPSRDDATAGPLFSRRSARYVGTAPPTASAMTA